MAEVSFSPEKATAAKLGAASISLLRQSLDNDAAASAQLLQSLPAPVQAPQKANAGSVVDVHA